MFPSDLIVRGVFILCEPAAGRACWKLFGKNKFGGIRNIVLYLYKQKQTI